MKDLNQIENFTEYFENNTRNQAEENTLLSQVGSMIMDGGDKMEDAFSWFAEKGEDALLNLAEGRVDLRSKIYDMMSRIYTEHPNLNSDKITSFQSETKALVYAKAAAFYEKPELKKSKTDRFDLLKKKMDQHFPEIPYDITFEESKAEEIDALNHVLKESSRYKKIPGANALWADYMRVLSSKGYYAAQNNLVLDYASNGNFEQAHQMLDEMKGSRISVDGKSGLEGFDETLEFVRQRERESTKNNTSTPQALKNTLSRLSDKGKENAPKTFDVKETQKMISRLNVR